MAEAITWHCNLRVMNHFHTYLQDKNNNRKYFSMVSKSFLIIWCGLDCQLSWWWICMQPTRLLSHPYLWSHQPKFSVWKQAAELSCNSNNTVEQNHAVIAASARNDVVNLIICAFLLFTCDQPYSWGTNCHASCLVNILITMCYITQLSF